MNTKNLRRNSRKCMRYIVVLFCKLLCVTCCSMKRGRIRRLEPGKIGGGRGTGGRSSKQVGGGISPGETAQQCSIFCNWIEVREPGMQGKEAGGLEPLPSMFKYPCVDLITGIYGKTPKFILPRTVTRGHQQGWTRQIWGTRKLILDLIRSVLHLFVCTPLQAQPVSMWLWREISTILPFSFRFWVTNTSFLKIFT